MESQVDRWEQFARRDPYFHVLSSQASYDVDDPADTFWSSGRADAESLLDFAADHLDGFERVLEIGCGPGRVLLSMAERFDHARGVDVAPTMLDLLDDACSRFDVSNVEGFLPDQPWDVDFPVDFAFSHIVFRHVEEFGVIRDYLRRIRTTLRPTGCAVLEFETRPITATYRVRNALPDLMLPREHRRGMRGIRRHVLAVAIIPALRLPALRPLLRPCTLRLSAQHAKRSE